MLNLHIYPSPLTHESRILRITDALVRAGVFSQIEVAGVGRYGLPEREAVDDHRTLVRVPRRMFGNRNTFAGKLMRTLEWSMRVRAAYRNRSLACVNAHSLAVLPLSTLLAWSTGAKLVYDTHELETETSGYKGVRQRIGKAIERLLIGRCDLVVAVSGAIADWYATTYSIRRPVVVRNIPQFSAPVEVDREARRASIGLSPDRITFIYQGGFIAGRGMERLLRVFAQVPEVDLVCMGSGPLQPLVSQAAAEHQNIILIPPVPPHEVLSWSLVADAGICLTDNSCLSHFYSLPNKIFEYLHAGLPIIVNPLAEQQAMVESLGCGWVAPTDDEDLKVMVRSIDRAALAQRVQGVAQAKATLQWSAEAERLVEAYRTAGIWECGRVARR